MKLLRNLSYCLLTLLISCSAEEECTASKGNQTGTYEMSTTEVSGLCGPIGDLTVEINDGLVEVADGLGCELTRRSWNGFTCMSSSVFDCDDGDWVMRLEWNVISSEDSGILTGTLKTTMSRWNGIYTCESEYDFTAGRVQ